MENMDMSELPEPVARIIAKMVEEPKLQLGKPEATKPPSPVKLSLVDGAAIGMLSRGRFTMSVSSSSAPQSSLPILLYPPKPGDDCQRGRKRRPAPATSVPYWGFICALRIPRSRRTLPADKAVSETHVA